MEDQFEESDALGMGMENCYEYDIAEDEEELVTFTYLFPTSDIPSLILWNC